MKKIMIVCVLTLLTNIVLVAQESQQNRVRTQERNQVQAEGYLLFRDGQLLRVRNQEQTRLQEQLRLENGTLVNPDGTYQLRNGKQKRLRAGECLSMEGRKYRSQDRIRHALERKSQRALRKRDRNRDQTGRKGKKKSGPPSR